MCIYTYDAIVNNWYFVSTYIFYILYLFVLHNHSVLLSINLPFNSDIKIKNMMS